MASLQSRHGSVGLAVVAGARGMRRPRHARVRRRRVGARVAIAAATISGQEAQPRQRGRASVVHRLRHGHLSGRRRDARVAHRQLAVLVDRLLPAEPLPSGRRMDRASATTLTAMGYGLAVLYVGQQTWGRRPGAPHMERVSVPKRSRRTSAEGRNRHKVTRTVTRTVLRKAPPPRADATCNADFVSGARGMREGVDAAQTHRARRLPARHDGLPRPRADGRAPSGDARLLLGVGARRARRRTLRARHLRPHRTTPTPSTTT